MLESLVQHKNAKLPISVTPLGILIDSMGLAEKVIVLIFVKPVGRLILESPQLANALSSIFFILFGNMMLSSFSQ